MKEKEAPPGEYICARHHYSWKDKQKCKEFAREVCKAIGGTKIKIFKTKKGWGFHVIFVKR